MSAMTRGHGAAGFCFAVPVCSGECGAPSGPPLLASPALSALPSLIGNARDSNPRQGCLGLLGRMAACGEPLA